MIRLSFLLSALYLFSPKTYGQFTVYKDTKGQILTSFVVYSSGVNASARTQVTYEGSPFLTFPVWQEGTVLLDRSGQELSGELAYNVVSNEVLCRFTGDSAVKLIAPETFTIQGTQFIRPQNSLSGTDYRPYFSVVYNGATKLLKSLRGWLVQRNGTGNGYDSDIGVSGVYHTRADYYIQKGQAKPELISLTKNSVLAVLYEQAEKLAAKLPGKKLTIEGVTQTIVYYDSLMAVHRINKQPLTIDPVFAQTLHDKLSYPDYARNQGVYGRVYAGFEIDEQGQINNVAILSPDENGGFRFDVMVRNVLEKLPPVDPICKGKYALPVAFTYTNTKEGTGPHIPINRLSDDRLEGRTLLDEFVVEAVVSKPLTVVSQEAWGYYK